MSTSDVVGLLKVALQANTAEFANGVDQASAKLKGFAKDADGVVAPFSRLKGAVMGISAALGTTAIANFVGSAISDIAKLDDMAKQTSASVEFLSSIKTVAKLAGTSVDEVAVSIQKLAINLGNAKLKGGDKADLFKQLGIDPASVKNVDEALVAIAKRVMEMPDRMKALSVARDLLGKNISIPFLEELAKAGPLIAKVTTEQANMAKQFEDDMIRLKAGAGQIGVALATAVLPGMNEILAFSLQVKKEWGLIAGLLVGLGGGTALKLLGQDLDPLKRAANESREALQNLQQSLKNLETAKTAQNAWWMVLPGVTDFQNYLTRQRGNDVQASHATLRAALAKQAALELKKTEDDYKAYQAAKAGKDLADGSGKTKEPDQYGPLMRQISERTQQMAAEAASTDRLTESQKFAIKVLSDLSDGYLKVSASQKINIHRGLENLLAQDAANQKTEEQRRLLEERRRKDLMVSDFTESGNTAIKRAGQDAETIGMSERQIKILEAVRRAEDEAAAARRRAFHEIKDPQLYQEAVAGINAALEKQKNDLADVTGAVYDYSTSWIAGAKGALAAYADEAGNMARSVSGLIGNMFSGMENQLVSFVTTGKADFKSLADSILADLARIWIQRSITGPLANALAGAFSSTATAAAGSGSSMPRYAQGTNYVPNDGPAFLHRGEAVIPAKYNTGASSGGGYSNINIHNYGGPQPTLREVPDGRGGRNLEIQIGEAVAAQMLTSGSMANRARGASTMVRRG